MRKKYPEVLSWKGKTSLVARFSSSIFQYYIGQPTEQKETREMQSLQESTFKFSKIL